MRELVLSLTAVLLLTAGAAAAAGAAPEDAARNDARAAELERLRSLQEGLASRAERALRRLDDSVPPEARLPASDGRCRREGLQPAVFIPPGWCAEGAGVDLRRRADDDATAGRLRDELRRRAEERARRALQEERRR